MWAYTPRQIIGFVSLASSRKKVEMAETLSLHTMAARGEEKAVKKLLRDWGKDGG